MQRKGQKVIKVINKIVVQTSTQYLNVSNNNDISVQII